jgi:hypothetical protein
MALRHPGVGVAELPSNDGHGHGLHGEDRRLGMPQHVESDLRDDAGARTGFAHRPQLFGALPAASVIALEQHIGGRTAADQPLDQLRRLARERDVAHPPALGFPDRQRLDVTVIVGDFEAAEFAIPAAGQERRMNEIAEGALAGVEETRDFLVGEVADDRGIDGSEGQASSDGTRPARQA